jgi:hypothetical protein
MDLAGAASFVWWNILTTIDADKTALDFPCVRRWRFSPEGLIILLWRFKAGERQNG